MVGPGRFRTRGRTATALLVVVVGIALVATPSVLGPLGGAAAAPLPGARDASSFTSHGYASWDTSSQNISSANRPSSAFALLPGQTAHVFFTFFVSTSSLPTGTSAELQLTYLGVVLTTSKVDLRPTILDPAKGTAEVNFSLGPIYDVLEGVFLLTASVGPSNASSTYWSEGFYIFAKAPYLLESAGVIILLILLVAESYWIASAFREAGRPPTGGASSSTPPPPPAGPAAGGSSSGGTPAPPPSGTAPTGNSPPPPSGGSS